MKFKYCIIFIYISCNALKNEKRELNPLINGYWKDSINKRCLYLDKDSYSITESYGDGLVIRGNDTLLNFIYQLPKVFNYGYIKNELKIIKLTQNELILKNLSNFDDTSIDLIEDFYEDTMYFFKCDSCCKELLRQYRCRTLKKYPTNF